MQASELTVQGTRAAIAPGRFYAATGISYSEIKASQSVA